MKKIFCWLLILSFAALAAQAATLERVRVGRYSDKIRLVFDFDQGITYETREAGQKIELSFFNTKASSLINNYTDINDLVIRYLEVEKQDHNLKVTIPLLEPVEYKIFGLGTPSRLIIDFKRSFLHIASAGSVAKGIDFLNIKKGSRSGTIKAYALKVDPKLVNLYPALAQQEEKTVIDSFISFFTPWVKESQPNHFCLNRVSEIVKRQQAVAAVNGTFFAYSGNPLGALVINQELISSPIYDRTAFFLDEKGKPYIDTVFVDSSFTLANGHRYQITGFNQSRSANDIIMYSPRFGKQTGSNNQGVELVVVNDEIKELNIGNSKIPKDGYVLSIAGPAVESLAENAKVKGPLKIQIKFIPYSTSPFKIIDLISGGPRLVKGGKRYVAKQAEKFRSDIAAGAAARTAVGITAQGEVLLVVVDGLPRKNRSPKESLGATLEELSQLMLDLGAIEAMNLDGGSSSTMVVRGQLINQPTNGYSRKVSNAIVLKPRD